MGGAIGDILPFAVGVAISPVPIIAVILMLFSQRASRNGPAFLAGWLVGLAIAVIVVTSIAANADVGGGEPSTVADLVKIGLGTVLIVLASRQWRTRPRAGEEPDQPTWMASIDTLQPSRAFVFGTLLSGVNPKNLTLAAGAALVIAQAALDPAQVLVAVVVFVALGSVSIIVPVAYALVGGESARTTLEGWKAWLGEHNAAVMAVLLFVMGVVLLGKGLGPLID
jgi:Sap, sulfolipid-1-addressing protein